MKVSAIKNPVGVGETYRVRREENRYLYYVVLSLRFSPLDYLHYMDRKIKPPKACASHFSLYRAIWRWNFY